MTFGWGKNYIFEGKKNEYSRQHHMRKRTPESQTAEEFLNSERWRTPALILDTVLMFGF